MPEQPHEHAKQAGHIFSGNIYIFHAFDVGDDIDLKKIKKAGIVISRPLSLSKYFKNYHIPLAIELPHPHTSTKCIEAKIHNFGAISLTYKIPFQDTLEEIQKGLEALDYQFQEQSVSDVNSIYKKIKKYIKTPKFFQTRSSYLVIEVDVEPIIDAVTLKEKYAGIIASMVRFETKTLSEAQKNEILEDSIGYFRGDLIVIDTEAAFVYDAEYEEILGFFEFANIQHLELRYFDRLLDQQLNAIYEEKVRKLGIKTYIPFIGTLSRSPVDELGKLKADISVITERLESSIKLVGEPYFSELYMLLVDKLGLQSWKDAIDKKLAIIKDVRSIFQHKVDAAREDLLSLLIIILILIELIVALVRK